MWLDRWLSRWNWRLLGLPLVTTNSVVLEFFGDKIVDLLELIALSSVVIRLTKNSGFEQWLGRVLRLKCLLVQLNLC